MHTLYITIFISLIPVTFDQNLHTYFLCSGEETEDKISWDEFHVYLDDKGCEIVKIPSDSLCYFRGVQNCLGVQYNERYSLEEIEDRVVAEISSRPKVYLRFYPDGRDQKGLINHVWAFFKDKFFACDTVDMLIGAVCNVFDITLWIYQRDPNDFMNLIQYSTGQESQKCHHCHLILYRDAGDEKGLGSHYNSVVSKKRNKGQKYEDYGIEENHEECQDKHVLNTTSPEINYVDDFEFDELGPPNPGTILTPTPTPTPEKEPNDFNPTYIREEPTSESMFDQPESAMYNSRDPGERIRFPELLLDELPVENIAKVPYDIYGNHHYKIHVPDKNWLKAQDDGRWFFMCSSTMRKTNKVHKIGKCLGSYVCRNDKCPKFVSGKGRNTYAFTRIGRNLQECKTCGSVADRDFCGALKQTIFNPDTNQLQVAYVGHHSCTLKSRASYTMIASPVKKSILKPILQKKTQCPSETDF